MGGLGLVEAAREAEGVAMEYGAYLSAAEAEAGVRRGELVRGKYRVNRNNPNEGTINTNFGFEVKIVGKAENNRAIMGDIVAVRLHAESMWQSKVHVTIADDEDTAEAESRGSTKTEDKKYASVRDKILRENLCPTGEVVAVIKRDLRNLAGQVSRLLGKVGAKSLVLVDPVDPRFPSTVLGVGSFERLKDQKIVFSVDAWPEGLGYPVGHLVSVFGKAEDMETESKVILFEHNVETRAFSKAVLDCLPQEGAAFRISEEEVSKRQDLRSYPIVG